jgi:hypothetical protein
VSRGRTAVALVLVVITLGLVGVADLVVPAPAATEDAPVATAGEEAISGRSVCAVGDTREGTSAAVDLVRPAADGEVPAGAEVHAFSGGDRDLLPSTSRLFPGAATRATPEPGDEGVATDVTWRGAPVTVARSWRIDGDDLPAGTASGPCAATTATDRWTIPGLTTEGGNEARVRLANPHPTGATVSLGLLTPEGPDRPTRLSNISVAPGETVELSLNEFAPERPDLGVIVDVRSGRVAVEGVQLAREDIGGIDGVSLLQAAREPGESWTIPWVADGDDRVSWLWVSNATDRSALVELTVHTPEGGAPATGLAEVQVPPGTVRRVDLRGTLPDGVEAAAITARSSGVPVTVGGTVEIQAEEAEDTGFAVQLGATAADEVWTVTGSSDDERNHQLRLVNPGSEPAVADVTVWNGSNVTQPADLQGIEVPPGALIAVPVTGTLDGAAEWAATIRASSGALVVGHVGSGDEAGPRHLVATLGAPSAWWRTGRDVPAVSSAPGTTQRLGTELGIEPVDPLAPAGEELDIDDPGLGEDAQVPPDTADVPLDEDGGSPAGEDDQDGDDQSADDEGTADPDEG